MRKIFSIYDNPIDNYLLEIADITTPYAYNWGMTPNMITTLSNIACIITILLLLNANYYWAALFVLISYYFDCMDGHMARKYNMVSVFGDYYDHISDFMKLIAILGTLYYINENKFYKILPIIILILLLTSVHLGCQELLYKKDESNTLKFTKKLCPVQDPHNTEMIQNTLMSTKLFGCGTFNITLAISMIYYAY